MTDRTSSVRELADELSVDPKAIRAWMRRQSWRHPVEAGSPWVLNQTQIDAIRTVFPRPNAVPDEPVALSGSGAAELAEVPVGQLLDRYAGILVELRLRGLVRTNNAPIGDLAEYCAAIVYNGLLAPNSKKGYDLVAEDGRRVQVKVRLIRPDTSPSAVFSPIRSFDFDVCIFVLIDATANDVLAATEWTAESIREIGKHRAHTNGLVVRVGQVRSSAGQSTDRSHEFRRAWVELSEQTR